MRWAETNTRHKSDQGSGRDKTLFTTPEFLEASNAETVNPRMSTLPEHSGGNEGLELILGLQHIADS